jgi:glutamate-5-semialdehyde dehydrogenase
MFQCVFVVYLYIDKRPEVVNMDIRETARMVERAANALAACDGEIKNNALINIVERLNEKKADIFAANRNDLERSEKESLPAPLIKRLKFDEGKLLTVIDGIRSLARMEDPVGKTLTATELDDGLRLYKVTCPIGVIGVIFESRPDALVQISSLCLKSGNGVLLKGGSEARETNRALADVIKSAAEEAGVPEGWLALLETRSDVAEMLQLDDVIDLVIPRGSKEFVRHIMENSMIPVLGHADGICHCYVDDEADIGMAVKVVVDSKTQYVAVCNALETLLVHEKAAANFLPALKQEMDARKVRLLGCDKTRAIIDADSASEEDWSTEYLDYILSVKIVGGLDEAIEHINRFGSGHTDAIITSNRDKALRFMNLVDSGNVFWNCSTRFSDGYRYGLGAEVGISTNKIHARGPVGLEGLLIYKYMLTGSGHIVAEYESGKRYKHIKFNGDFRDI